MLSGSERAPSVAKWPSSSPPHSTAPAEFWLAAQRAIDLYEARQRISKLPKPRAHLAT
jgi:hypothetical protein